MLNTPPKTPTVYWDYLGLERLLSLQGGLAGDDQGLTNDEVLFIVVHQIDELWFKLAIRELASVRDLFAEDPVPEQSLQGAVRGLRRLALLFRKASEHFELMETMTTRDYLGFRDKLSPASGFQSFQLREVEILLGLGAEERVPLGQDLSYLDALRGPGGSETIGSRRVAARLADTPCLRDAVHAWLYRTPIEGSRPGDPGDAARVGEFVASFVSAHEREVSGVRDTALEGAPPQDRERLTRRYEEELASARAFLEARDVEEESQRARVARIRAAIVFIESYRELPLLAWPREVLDAVIQTEQAFLVFRQRHARMVERVIGRRTGTGGSAGVDYLDATALRYRVFRDVWAVRTVLLRAGALPPIREAQRYGFAPG